MRLDQIRVLGFTGTMPAHERAASAHGTEEDMLRWL
jgi:hypothetical protein